MISLWPHTEAIQFCQHLSVAISPLCTGQEGTADIFIYVVSVLDFLWTAFKRLHLLVESWPLTWVDYGVCNIILLDSWHNCNLDTSMQIRIVSQIKITHLKQLPVMSFFHSSLVSQSWIIQQKPWCLLLVAPL